MHDLIESIHDVASFLAKPGKYHTSTGHQAYFVLQSLQHHPQVRLGDELYFPEGSVLFAEVLAEPVGQLAPNMKKMVWGTDDDFYQRRLRDYDNWETAFWREIVQNSRDAGATRLDLRCEEGVYDDPESGESVPCIVCSANDNGSGMDYDTLFRAFFRRGGSEKSAGSVGGFGDAKNLILTPWLGYEVRTRDVVAVGRHEELYADLTKKGQPYRNGTLLTVWMPLQKTTTPQHAQFLIEQSSLPQIQFSINGVAVHASLPDGTVVLEKPITIRGRTVGQLIVHHAKNVERTGIYIRSHGIYMFESHGFSDGDGFKGIVTIEVNAPPIDVFTTKRDQLSYESSVRGDVAALLKQLSTDPALALKAKRDKKEVVFKGQGTIDVREGRVAAMAADIAARVDLSAAARKRKAGKPLQLDTATMKALVDQVGIAIEGEGETGMVPLLSTFNTLMEQNAFVDVEQVAIAVHMAMWKPDFHLYQNISPWDLPKQLHPSTMTKKYHELIRVWTEVCRFVMVQLGMQRSFGIGWVFDTDYDPKHYGERVIAALYRKHEDVDWLLLNPVEIEISGSSEPFEFKMVGDRFDLSDPLSMEKLVTLAVHEITHMQGFLSHNDSYASALTENMKAIFRLAPVLKKIIRESRAATKEARGTKKRKTSRPATSVRGEVEKLFDEAPIRWAQDNDDWMWGYRGPNSVALLRRVGDRWELAVSASPNGRLLSEWELAADRNAPATARDLEAAKRVAECAVAEMAKTGTAVWEPRNHEEYRYGTMPDTDSTVMSTRRASNGYVPRIWVGGEWVSMRHGYEDEAIAMNEAEAAYRFYTCVKP